MPDSYELPDDEKGKEGMNGDVTVEYGESPDPPKYHVGMIWVGITLFSFMVYSLYSGRWDFGLYNAILLVVLALGSKFLN